MLTKIFEQNLEKHSNKPTTDFYSKSHKPNGFVIAIYLNRLHTIKFKESVRADVLQYFKILFLSKLPNMTTE